MTVKKKVHVRKGTRTHKKICALKSLRDGRILMEIKSKEEIELLHADITEKCSQLLEVNIQKPRNPKLVV